jgi:hypothetical protein
MVALLAPVPEEHLVSALDVVREHRKVAFGKPFVAGISTD